MEEYRKNVFEKSQEECENLLDEYYQVYINDEEESMIEKLKRGMKIFEITEGEYDEDEFQKQYSKVLHKIVVLHHKFIVDNNLEKEHLKRFNQLFEIIYYWEKSIRSMFRVMIASKTNYSTITNSDIGISRFRPIDTTVHNSFQNLIFYMLSCFTEHGYRRQEDRIMKRVNISSGYDTHSWKEYMTIRDYILLKCQRDQNYNQWFNLTHNSGNLESLSKYLRDAKDSQFPDVVKDRRLFSFKNGIYEICIYDEENDIYQDRWYSHDDSHKFHSNEIDSDRSACKFFEYEFNYDYKASLGEKDWYEIETPFFQSILDYQEFPEEVCRWAYVLMCGRILYEVGEIDDWQILPFLKGIAKSGKSTILTKVCRDFYESIDVGVLSNNVEKKFGLSALTEKLLFIAPEIKENFNLEQTEFQSMISGEDISVAEKFKTAKSVVWKTPGIFAGNRPLGYEDNQGSIARRIILFVFGKEVKSADTRLGKKLQKEIPMILYKGNLAYLEAVNKYGKRDIWKALPKYFLDTRNDMASQTNPLIHFLASDAVILGENQKCRQRIFTQYFNEHIRENNLKKPAWKKDFYLGPFGNKEIKVERSAEYVDPIDGRIYRGVWYMGVGIRIQNIDDLDGNYGN